MVPNMQILVVDQAEQNKGNFNGMKALLIFMWNVKGEMSKYDNMMVIEGEGEMPKYDGWWQ